MFWNRVWFCLTPSNLLRWLIKFFAFIPSIYCKIVMNWRKRNKTYYRKHETTYSIGIFRVFCIYTGWWLPKKKKTVYETSSGDLIRCSFNDLRYQLNHEGCCRGNCLIREWLLYRRGTPTFTLERSPRWSLNANWSISPSNYILCSNAVLITPAQKSRVSCIKFMWKKVCVGVALPALQFQLTNYPTP